MFEVPPRTGVKVAVWPPLSDALAGDKLMVTGGGGALAVNTMEETAVLVVSAWLTAVSVIICCDLTVDGAV